MDRRWWSGPTAQSLFATTSAQMAADDQTFTSWSIAVRCWCAQRSRLKAQRILSRHPERKTPSAARRMRVLESIPKAPKRFGLTTAPYKAPAEVAAVQL